MHLPQRSANNRRTELTSLASTIRLNFELWLLSCGTGWRQRDLWRFWEDCVAKDATSFAWQNLWWFDIVWQLKQSLTPKHVPPGNRLLALSCLFGAHTLLCSLHIFPERITEESIFQRQSQGVADKWTSESVPSLQAPLPPTAGPAKNLSLTKELASRVEWRLFAFPVQQYFIIGKNSICHSSQNGRVNCIHLICIPLYIGCNGGGRAQSYLSVSL